MSLRVVLCDFALPCCFSSVALNVMCRPWNPWHATRSSIPHTTTRRATSDTAHDNATRHSIHVATIRGKDVTVRQCDIPVYSCRVWRRIVVRRTVYCFKCRASHSKRDTQHSKLSTKWIPYCFDVSFDCCIWLLKHWYCRVNTMVVALGYYIEIWVWKIKPCKLSIWQRRNCVSTTQRTGSYSVKLRYM